MKIPLSWLKEYIDLDESPSEIAKTLTLAGIEVDALIPSGSDLLDTVFEISLTPNLGHISSVLGIARELSAAYGRPFKLPDLNLYEDDFTKISDNVVVEVIEPSKVLRYTCREAFDVTVGESPKWLQERLELSGLRPVNNIVDITNYVMLALGHPLHAFDCDKLEDKKIVVTLADEGEIFHTLDGEKRVLKADDLVIRDGKKTVALAGVMGGANSEITSLTKNVLIEAAHFSPQSIRKTSKRLGIQSDASKRFERGTDPNILSYALDLAANLIQSLGMAKVAKGLLDVKENEIPKKRISCRLSRINELLGTHLGASEVESIFKKLEMEPVIEKGVSFILQIPTYRNDIQTEIDLVEEVARIYGYDNIPKVSPKYHGSTLPHSPLFLFEKKIRGGLLQLGLQEFLNCDLIGPSLLSALNGFQLEDEAIVKVLNPTSIEQSILRTSLLPGLLQSVKYNFDHQNGDVAAFEIGRIHFKLPDQEDKYREELRLGIILMGQKEEKSWMRQPKLYDFYDLKGILEHLLETFGVSNYSFKESLISNFHDRRQAVILATGREIKNGGFENERTLEIGSLGEIHPSIQRKLDLPERVLFAEINLQAFYSLVSKEKKMVSLSLYPSSTRDWTVTLKDEVSHDQLINNLKKVPSKLLESFSLIDIYRSEKLGAGLKNVTLRFVYRGKEKTVSQEEVDAEHANLINETVKLNALI